MIMQRLFLVAATVAVIGFPSTVGAQVVYDFAALTGGAFPGTALGDDADDSWTFDGGGINVRDDGGTFNDDSPAVGFTGFDNSYLYRQGNGDTRASRLNDGVFSIPAIPNTGDVSLSFVVRGQLTTGVSARLMEFGLAAGGHTGTVGPTFGLFGGEWFIRAEDDPGNPELVDATIPANGGVSAAEQGFLVTLEMDIDTSLGSLSVQNLEGGPVIAVPGLQDYDLGISDPTAWDSLYVRLFRNNAALDNLSVTATAVPEPSAAFYLCALSVAFIGRRRWRNAK